MRSTFWTPHDGFVGMEWMMSYLNALSALPWDWVLLGGGLGGALNAAFSSNLRLLPSWSPDARGIGASHVIRVGLLASSAVGASAAAGLLLALRGMTEFDGLRVDEVPFRLVISSFFVGFVTARGVTSEVDKILLRLAVRNAAAAPAAHPEVALAIDHAPPYAVYNMAVELMPRRRSSPPGRIHVTTAFDKVQAQRL